MVKEKLDYFDKLILQSIEKKGHRNENKPNHLYYDEDYAIRIREYFSTRIPKIDSYEANFNKEYGVTPICAFASSGRLCYLDFRNRQNKGLIPNLAFELPLKNDIKNSPAPTKIDAADLDKLDFYECKCQEIRGKKKDGLRESYETQSALFRSFGIKTGRRKSKKDDKGRYYVELTFPVSELGIALNDDPQYTDLHFDLKQLICHLIAIANQNYGRKASLRYVIYKPDQALIDSNGYAKRLYRELETEIEAIFREGTKIDDFAKKHDIDIQKPEFVPISSIKDFNYEETYND